MHYDRTKKLKKATGSQKKHIEELLHASCYSKKIIAEMDQYNKFMAQPTTSSEEENNSNIRFDVPDLKLRVTQFSQ